jgi:hypothetical protein
MTERELKKYALTGLLVRIDAEEKRLPKVNDKRQKEHIAKTIFIMKKQYNELLEELRGNIE